MNGSRHTTRGLTIIEMMVSLAIAGFITLAVTQLFAANSETYLLLRGQSTMQESGQFALMRLANSIHSAGYRGCQSREADIYRTFVPDLPYEFDIMRPIVGFEGETTAWAPDIETVLPKTVGAVNTNVYDAAGYGNGNGIDTTAILRGTDILTVRHIGEKRHRLAANMPTSTEDIDTVTTDFDFAQDYLAFIYDCEKGTAFRVTGFGAAGEIKHEDTVDPDGFTNSIARLAEFNTFEMDAYVSAIESHTYFVAPGTARNNTGQTPMSLWVKTALDPPVELIEGIEDLQIQFGVDSNADGVPNRYIESDSVVDFDDVVTIRLSVVATSVDDVGATLGPTHGCLADGGRQYCVPGEDFDGSLRRSYSQTINIRNR